MKFMPLCLTAENLSEVQTDLERELASLKVAEKDILRTQLLVEELSLRMLNQGHAAKISVRVVKQLFGKIQVKMTAEGVSYNPLVEVTDLSEDDDDYYSVMILKVNRLRLHRLRKDNFNIVTIDVRGETNKQLWLLLAAIFGGIVCGVVMKTTLSPESIALVNDNIIIPIRTMFLNALGMIIAPVIFFSVISGVIGMGAGASVGKIGTKLIGLYMCTSVVSTLIGLIVAQIFFSGEVPQIGSIPTANAEVDTYEFSLINFIVDIIPANLIAPVANGNMIQIIFVAVLFGISLNALGDKVQYLQEIVRNCNEFFMNIVNMIVFFVPLIAFFAMTMLIVDTGLEMLLIMGKLIIGQLTSSCLMLGLYMLTVAFVGKISPVPFLKKIPPLMSVPFATSSSAVTMPFTMKFCTEKLGIAPKITSFSIPIGTTINMDGVCCCLSLTVIMFLKMYGIDVDLNAMLIIVTMTLSISVGAPAVPNVIVICILTVTETFGVPNDIAGVLFCLSAVSDRFATCFNVAYNAAATLILGRTENLVDEKIYFN